MSTETVVWKALTRLAPTRVLGFFPGAMADGLVCAVPSGVGSGSPSIAYRGFRLVTSSAGPELLEEWEVGGLEILPDVAAAVRVPIDSGTPLTRGNIIAAVRSVLPGESVMLGELSSSDATCLLSIRDGADGPLRTVAAWWEDATTLLILPIRLSVPITSLLALRGQTAEDRDTHPAVEPVSAATTRVGVVSAPQRRTRKALITSAVAMVLAAGTWLAMKGGTEGTEPTKPETARAMSAPTDSAPSRSDSAPSAGVGPGVVPVPDTSQPREGQRSRRGSERVAPGTAKERPEPLPTQVPTAPTTDTPQDEQALKTLQDRSTDTTTRSSEQWQALGARAEQLFARLIEPQNRSEAARVVLRLYMNAGGRPEACRYLSEVRDLTSGERSFFSSQNRCS